MHRDAGYEVLGANPCGGAAARLVGADVGEADLDVLTSVRDADALRDRRHPRKMRRTGRIAQSAFYRTLHATVFRVCRWK